MNRSPLGDPVDQRDTVALGNAGDRALAPCRQNVDFEHPLGVGVGAGAAILRDVLCEVIADQGVDRIDFGTGPAVALALGTGIDAGMDLVERLGGENPSARGFDGG
jgi:hypothetical protein